MRLVLTNIFFNVYFLDAGAHKHILKTNLSFCTNDNNNC